MNFSSTARLASMVTDRKRGSRRRSTADRSAVSATSRTWEEFWSWFRRRTPPVPEVRTHRNRSEVAARSMTGSPSAAARALHFLPYFLVYRRQATDSSDCLSITDSAAGWMNLGAGPSADINSACMKGEVGSQEPSSFVYLFSSLNWEVILQFVIFFPSAMFFLQLE